MVLMRVDFPRPVWPIERVEQMLTGGGTLQQTHTNDDHVELEATLQELVLNLRGDAVETNVRRRANLFRGGRGHCLCQGENGVGTKDGRARGRVESKIRFSGW